MDMKRVFRRWKERLPDPSIPVRMMKRNVTMSDLPPKVSITHA